MQYSTSFYAVPDSVHVKSVYNRQSRHTHLEGGVVSLETLEERLHLAHGLSGWDRTKIRLFFEDPDGDLCPLNDDDELIGAMRLSPIGSLKVYVRYSPRHVRIKEMCRKLRDSLYRSPRRNTACECALNAATGAAGSEVRKCLSAASAAVHRNADGERVRAAACSLRRRTRRFISDKGLCGLSTNWLKNLNELKDLHVNSSSNAQPEVHAQAQAKCDVFVSDIKGVLWSYGVATESVEKCGALVRAMLHDCDCMGYVMQLRRHSLCLSTVSLILPCFGRLPKHEKLVVAESVHLPKQKLMGVGVTRT